MQDLAQAELIKLAATIADHRSRDSRSDDWLREFRKAYRHMAVSTGETFGQATLDIAEGSTDQTLAAKA
jgi:hypothetical protein